MNLFRLFTSVLNAKYIHVGSEKASFNHSLNGDTLTILFEWSNGKTDWKNNFDFPAKPYRDMQDKWKCHRGFLKVWKAIEPYLKEFIADGKVKKITIAGYSHGAAIALLCHEYCKFNRPDCEVTGYGFGSPRVIWGNPNNRVKERFEGFTVVKNKGDIVTHLPPVIFGYRHVNSVLKLDCDENCINAHKPDTYKETLLHWENNKC